MRDCIELTTAFQKIKKWFYNHKENTKKTVVIEVPTPSRPRATTAHECFGSAFKEEIKEKLNAERGTTGGLIKDNLSLYRRILDDMYNAADDETRETFEKEASAFNAQIRELPDRSEIYAYGSYAHYIPCADGQQITE